MYCYTSMGASQLAQSLLHVTLHQLPQRSMVGVGSAGPGPLPFRHLGLQAVKTMGLIHSHTEGFYTAVLCEHKER